jgi:hypothetical protein
MDACKWMQPITSMSLLLLLCLHWMTTSWERSLFSKLWAEPTFWHKLPHLLQLVQLGKDLHTSVLKC